MLLYPIDADRNECSKVDVYYKYSIFCYKNRIKCGNTGYKKNRLEFQNGFFIGIVMYIISGSLRHKHRQQLPLQLHSWLGEGG